LALLRHTKGSWAIIGEFGAMPLFLEIGPRGDRMKFAFTLDFKVE